MYKLEVNIAKQAMNLYQDDQLLREYSISTAKNGAGEIQHSEMTPRGRHIIRAKIGKDAPENAVFVRRRTTGEIYSYAMREQFPGRDWILTRIMWLCGLQPGENRFGKVDTMRRFIYIHGTPDDVRMGSTGSRGCIRMRNNDIIELFDIIPVGTSITIT